MNIIKAVKTANKIQKVKVKSKKTLATAGKIVIGAAVLGIGVLALHHNKVKKRDAKNKKEISHVPEKKDELTKIEYKRQKKMAKLQNRKNDFHGTGFQSDIHAESVNI